MKPIEINSFLDFQYVSSPGFSPCGTYAAFVVQRAVLEDNRYDGDIYILDVETKKSRRLTAAGGAKSYVWTKEGTLLFPATRDEKLKKKAEEGEELTCWYEISPWGGEAALAFTLPLRANRLLPLDSDRYVVTATFDNNRPNLDGMEGEARKKALEQLKAPAYEVLEEAPFWFNGRGFTTGKRTRLYLYTRSTGELKAVTGPWFDAAGYAVRGGKLLYKGVEWHGILDQKHYDGIYLYDMETGEDRRVLAPGTSRTGALEFWDDGSAIVAASDGAKYGMLQYMDFYTLDLTGGAMTLLTPYEASIGGSSVGSDARLGGGNGTKLAGEKYYFITTLGDGGYLRSIDRDGTISPLLTPDGSCDSFDAFEGNTLVCGMYGQALAELYLNGEQVTFFNDGWRKEHRTVLTPCGSTRPSSAPPWQRPPLFIQSDEDYRCWMSNALQMFTALKMNGVDARMVLFHGENHELSRSGKPQNRITRLTEIGNWFEKHLKGS